MLPLYFLDNDDSIFPHPQLADEEGLLAIGGDLNIQRLLTAYSFGIFPWYNEEDPILWWSPDPRAVFKPSEIKISKSMRPFLKKYQLKIDTNFPFVIEQCRDISRDGITESWITDDMLNAYIKLHELGYAHSFECWYEDKLIGGLYGVSLGKCFFGESMFSQKANASKFALIKLAQLLDQKDYWIIDCQIPNDHLNSLGCTSMPRIKYLQLLQENRKQSTPVGSWNNWI